MRGWIDYRYAEQSLFDALLPELRLRAADYRYHFGAQSADMAEDFAEGIFPKAADILNQHGHRRVFTDKKLYEKCQRWAAYWCRRAARPSKRHTVFDDQARAKSIETRTTAADRRAQKAQRWRAAGKSVAWIADKLGCTRQTVYNLFKRIVKSVSSLACTPKFKIQEPAKEKIQILQPTAAVEELGQNVQEILRNYWQETPINGNFIGQTKRSP